MGADKTRCVDIQSSTNPRADLGAAFPQSVLSGAPNGSAMDHAFDLNLKAADSLLRPQHLSGMLSTQASTHPMYPRPMVGGSGMDRWEVVEGSDSGESDFASPHDRWERPWWPEIEGGVYYDDGIITGLENYLGGRPARDLPPRAQAPAPVPNRARKTTNLRRAQSNPVATGQAGRAG